MVQIIFRHGARYSLHSELLEGKPERDFYLEKEGQLTQVGMRQHYNLGQALRKEYIFEKKFLEEKYQHENIFAFTSNVNRTIQSLQSFLFGFYPLKSGFSLPQNLHGNLQKAPYYNSLQKEGNFTDDENEQFALPLGFYPYVIQQNLEQCKLFYNLFKIIFKLQKKNEIKENILNFKCNEEKKKLQEKNKQENEEFFDQFYVQYDQQIKEISKKANIDQNFTMNNVSSLIDWIICQRHLGYSYGITQEEFTTLVYIKSVYKLRVYFTEIQNKLILTPYLRFLLEQFQLKMQNQTSLKITIASTHDTQITPLMILFKLMYKDCQWNDFQEKKCYLIPEFASNIIFELYQEENGDYSVQVKYNGQYLKICQGKESCQYQEFEKLIQEYIYEEYDSYCGSQCQQQKQEENDKGYFIAFWIIFGSNLLGLLAYIVAKKRSQSQQQFFKFSNMELNQQVV